MQFHQSKQKKINNPSKKFGASWFGCFHPKQSAPEGEQKEDELAGTSSKFRVFSYNELKAATQGFTHKIGQGGFGSVYKGRLTGDDFIAVKVISVEVESMRGERDFISEIAALSDIKHENLVTLRGCCVEGAQRLLVYDFMENNSLRHTFSGGMEKRMKFTWILRKSVSLGIARGLCFLHEEVNPHIVHRDIKGGNILLDKNYVPKIADFGLARLFRDNISHLTTHVAGTLGYISPEYAHTGHLTRKSDVYSFGVLLLEIVSGQPVVDYHLRYGEQLLVQKAWEMYMAENLLELVDFALNGNFSHEEAIRFLKVGLLCVQETTRLRPAMCTAVKMLTNEIDTEDIEISRPGLLADPMEVKIRKQNLPNISFSLASSSTESFQAR